MCGIYGVLGHIDSATPTVLGRMGDLMAHRGPDDRGIHVDAAAGIGLGHNRLSIIDLSAAGHQPMMSPDRSVVLSFNGEIYNYLDLRRELEALGHQFFSKTDTEVLLWGFRAWGDGLFARLKGMFAVAIWDAARAQLLLARDPSGMKPLYIWSNKAGSTFFASEVKAFLAVDAFDVALDLQAVSQYLEFNFVYDQARTSLQGVQKLPPGCVMRLLRGQPAVVERFYQAPMPHGGGSSASDIDAAVHQLHETFLTVVGQHLMADVPVGMLLSGGLDSSLVAAAASRHQRVKTISFAFSDSKIDETGFARQVSAFLGTDHQDVVISPADVIADMPRNAWFVDDLFGDWGMLSTRMLYEHCQQQGIKVVLVGEGADELFGGYHTHALAGESGNRLALSLQLYRWYSGRRWGRELPRFVRLLGHILAESAGSRFGAVQRFEAQYQMPSHYNMKVDKASMSVSVEARCPFQDVRLADIAYAAGPDLMLRSGENKWLLREMARRHAMLPPEIIARKKFGASMASSWIDESAQFRRYARDVILDPGSLTHSLGLRPAMLAYFDKGRLGFGPPSGIGIFSVLAWRLLLLNLWHRTFVDRQRTLRAA